MNISVLQLCLKYAEASNRLEDSFTKVFSDFQSWLLAIDLNQSNTKEVKYMINIMTTIIDNGFCGEWMMFYYDNPWAVIEEYDL